MEFVQLPDSLEPLSENYQPAKVGIRVGIRQEASCSPSCCLTTLPRGPQWGVGGGRESGRGGRESHSTRCTLPPSARGGGGWLSGRASPVGHCAGPRLQGHLPVPTGGCNKGGDCGRALQMAEMSFSQRQHPLWSDLRLFFLSVCF